ncbi:MAG TPA: hypothetical protein VJO99_24515 [Burkholderiaceae bacterium]|nr:hypothetical protein [Burkholderiaceae bacterium]
MAAAVLVPDRADLLAGLKQGLLLGLAVAALTLPGLGTTTSRIAPPRMPAGHAALGGPAALYPTPRVAAFGTEPAGGDAHAIADWVATTRDNRAMPFAILDKRGAQVYVFDADARLIGASRVLLGAAPGDDTVPGIGQRPMDQVRPEEKTTPAGRFVSHPGRNASGEEVIWVDYGAAVSMHRVRIVDPKERRLERLASGAAAERRISYGCINIPVAFFDAVLRPTLGAAPAVVYVLPERKALHEAFPAYAAPGMLQVAGHGQPVLGRVAATPNL